MEESRESGATAKVVEEIEHAKEDLSRARADEHRAEEELTAAVAEFERAERDECKDHKVEVHVTHINDLESVNFKEPLDATLQAIWDEAYNELKITKKPKDTFQTDGDPPVSLMNHLGLTLTQARKRGVITNFKFEIVSETGGACRGIG